MDGAALIVSVLWLVFLIWCAVRTALNGRWVLFILGFLCGVTWIIGAFAGSDEPWKRARKRQQKDYERAMRREAKNAPSEVGPVQSQPAASVGERCPTCGRPGPHGERCAVCGHRF